MKILVAFLALTIILTGEIIDRVAIAIGNRTITELQIDEELRMAALLNHKPLIRDQKARRDAADRLIQQFLIRGEMRVSRYPDPDPAEVTAYLDQVAKDFGGVTQLDHQIKQYGLDKATFLRHLEVQLATLRFIEIRFSQQGSAGNADVQASIHDQQNTDEALAAWLEEARKQFNIVYLDKTLQ